MKVLLLLSLVLTCVSAADVAAQQDSSATAAKSPQKVPIEPWLERHSSHHNRPFEADLEVDMYLGAQMGTVLFRGHVALADDRNYAMQWEQSSRNANQIASAEFSASFIADGRYLWTENRQKGHAESKSQISRTSLSTIDKLHLASTLRSGAQNMFDPLALIFDMRGMLESYQFSYQGQRPYEKRKVFTFVGKLRSPEFLQDRQMKDLYHAGAREIELAFESRSGLVVYLELRGPKMVFQRVQLREVRFDSELRPGQFRYRVPDGEGFTDRDPELERLLKRELKGQQEN